MRIRIGKLFESHDTIAIVAHRLADVDATTSSAAIILAAEKLGRRDRLSLYIPEGPSKKAREILERYSIRYLTEMDELLQKKPDLMIFLDHSSANRIEPRLLDYIEHKGTKILVIDHHPPDARLQGIAGDSYLVYPNRSSTAEIVAELLMEEDLLTDEEACLLIMGVLADTKGLQMIGCDDLPVLHRLCETCGIKLSELRDLLVKRPDYSEIIAKMKGARRMRILKVGKWVIAVTTVDSYQSSVAQALMSLGADLAIAVGKKKRSVMGNLRSSTFFHERTGVHTGDLAKTIAERLNGSGGGHANAAAFQVSADLGTTIDVILDVLREALGERLEDVI